MTTERPPMTRARHPERDMHLPDGMTCADCRHFARCEAIFGHIATDEVCDWSPSRFLATERAATSAALAKDAAAGMIWWNTRSEDDRLFWMLASLGTTPADAWAYFKRCDAAGVVSSAAQATGSAARHG